MRFVDEAHISVKAGKGGAGCVSFRREKFIPRGGPNGGDGGAGGNVIVKTSARLLSLYDFRLKRRYEAENGQPGQGSQMHGRNGNDVILELPLGTLIYEITPEGERLIADLNTPDFCEVIARGGQGGKGNEHFKSSTMQAPRFAQPGEPGEELTLRLELKILADAGLLGLPNAGKSTFISKVSAARPRIAPYPFTTLSPNLGVMLDDDDYEHRLVIADIPGLIEGAHAGQGLGHRFLKHVERTRFLVHILSAEDINPDDPWAGFRLINEELALFEPRLAQRSQIEVVNKIDLLDEESLEVLKERARADGRKIFFISALQEEGLEELKQAMWELNDNLPQSDVFITPRSAEDLFAAASRPHEAEEEDDFDEDDYSDIEVIWTKE
ncbi:MAG: GTPase ObgE [Desulfovibrionaceae bacterium]|nr:GTPase ObgE [Desulfovibrionaceae bacterium]